jgi:hypothetical protein
MSAAPTINRQDAKNNREEMEASSSVFLIFLLVSWRLSLMV